MVNFRYESYERHGNFYEYYVCSDCGSQFGASYKVNDGYLVGWDPLYCPVCGAKRTEPIDNSPYPEKQFKVRI